MLSSALPSSKATWTSGATAAMVSLATETSLAAAKATLASTLASAEATWTSALASAETSLASTEVRLLRASAVAAGLLESAAYAATLVVLLLALTALGTVGRKMVVSQGLL